MLEEEMDHINTVSKYRHGRQMSTTLEIKFSLLQQ